jgi:hypothetical protein
LPPFWGNGAEVKFAGEGVGVGDAKMADVSVVSGDFDVKCRVCGLSEYNLKDMDKTEGVAHVVLEFGPNLIQESTHELDEGVIEGYAVFELLDEASEFGSLHKLVLEDAVKVVAKSTTWSPNPGLLCECNATQYKVELENLTLPTSGGGLKLMVVPYLLGGEVLPIGVTTEPIEDFLKHLRGGLHGVQDQ